MELVMQNDFNDADLDKVLPGGISWDDVWITLPEI